MSRVDVSKKQLAESWFKSKEAQSFLAGILLLLVLSLMAAASNINKPQLPGQEMLDARKGLI